MSGKNPKTVRTIFGSKTWCLTWQNTGCAPASGEHFWIIPVDQRSNILTNMFQKVNEKLFLSRIRCNRPLNTISSSLGILITLFLRGKVVFTRTFFRSAMTIWHEDKWGKLYLVFPNPQQMGHVGVHTWGKVEAAMMSPVVCCRSVLKESLYSQTAVVKEEKSLTEFLENCRLYRATGLTRGAGVNNNLNRCENFVNLKKIINIGKI